MLRRIRATNCMVSFCGILRLESNASTGFLEHFGRRRKRYPHPEVLTILIIFQLGFAFQHYTIITIGVITK